VRPGCAADHSPPSSAAVIEEYSYTSIHPLDHTGPVTGKLCLLLCILHVIIGETHSQTCDYFPALPKYEDFHSINSRIKAIMLLVFLKKDSNSWG